MVLVYGSSHNDMHKPISLYIVKMIDISIYCIFSINFVIKCSNYTNVNNSSFEAAFKKSSILSLLQDRDICSVLFVDFVLCK